MNKGKITQIIGAVVDCEFEPNQLPQIYNALEVDRVQNAGNTKKQDKLV